MTDSQGSEKSSVVERHFQSFISVIAVALMVWVGSTLNGLQQDFAAMNQQVVASSAQLNAGIAERKELRERYIDLLLRIDRLEQDALDK